MSGTAVTLYNNFMEAQGPLYINSADEVYNNAQAFRKWTTGKLMGGDRGKSRMVTGGSEIRFSTFFQTGQVTRHIQPGETRVWSQPQKLVHGAAPMRYRESHMAWTRQVIMQNEGMRNGDFDQFVNHKLHLEQMMWTDYWNFDEAHVWSEPDAPEMEGMNGVEGKFYSIPAFINEYTNGLYNNSGTAGTAFTTINGINPASTTKGQNRYVHPVVTYSNAITTQDKLLAGGTVLAALSKAWRKAAWEKPAKMGQFFDDPSYSMQQIFTSPVGALAYEIALRNSGDIFVLNGRPDTSITDPVYNFIPVNYIDALSNATLYPAGTAGSITNNVAESSSSCLYGKGPRYYFINSNFLFPFFDPDMYFERGEVRNHFNDPDTFVQPVFIWGNMICPRRDMHVLIRPSQGVYTNLYT